MNTSNPEEAQVFALQVERVCIQRQVVIWRRRPPTAQPDVVEGRVAAAVPALPPASASAPPELPEFDLEEPPVNLFDLLDGLGELPAMTAALGVTEDDAPLLLRFAADGAHDVLITGGAGAGKSTLLRTLALALALTNPPSQLKLAVVDPSRRAALVLKGLPHLFAPPAVRPGEVERLMHHLLREVDDRCQEAGRSEPRVVVLVNQPADWIRTAGVLAVGDLIHLARDGNRVGIHHVCSEAHPERLADELLMCFPVRLVGRVPDAGAARRAAGREASGAEALVGGGDFLAITAGGVVRFWAAACSALDAQRAVVALASGRAPGQLSLAAQSVYNGGRGTVRADDPQQANNRICAHLRGWP